MAATVLGACGGDDGGGGSGASATGASTTMASGTDTDTDGTATATATDSPTTTAPTTTATTDAPTTMESTTTDPSAGSSEASGPGQEGENGDICDTNDDCVSGFCFDTGVLGGICGDCAGDADCSAGCHPPNPFLSPATPSFCEDNGAMGTACEDSSACDGGADCTLVFAFSGVLDIRGCSSCETTKDCIKGEICTPTYDLTNLGGSRSCVAIDTLGDAEACDPSQSPDACTNFCRSVDFQELATLGVCSPCNGAGECMKMQECGPAEVVDNELVPAGCVDIPPDR